MPSNARRTFPPAIVPSHAAAAFLELRRTFCATFKVPEPRADISGTGSITNSVGVLDDCLSVLLESHLSAALTDSDDIGRTPTEIHALAGHRLPLIRVSLSGLHALGLRPLPSVRGRRFALPHQASAPIDLTPLAENVEQMLDADFMRDEVLTPLRPNLKLLLDILRGDAELADVEAVAPAIVRKYARMYEDERDRIPTVLEPWQSQDWRRACADASGKLSCILPKGHIMGHHRREAGPHTVELGANRLDVMEFLEKIRVETWDDAAAWIQFYRDRHFHTALRLTRSICDDAVAVRELIDLALHENWIREGSMSPGMRKLRHRVEHLRTRGTP